MHSIGESRIKIWLIKNLKMRYFGCDYLKHVVIEREYS